MPASEPSGHYAYGYLLGALFYVLLWAVIFWRRGDLRREMLVMSALSVLYGLPHEYLLWTRDWWHPPTITGTRIGLEDLLYAIGNGGVLAVVYTVVVRRNLVAFPSKASPLVRLLPYLVNGLIPPLLVVATGMHSFLASGAGALLALAVILRARPDLAVVAAGSAILGTIASLPFYLVMEGALPGFIAHSWYLDRLSGILIWRIPVEDMLWYIYTAALWGTYYKYAANLRVAPASPPAPVVEGYGGLTHQLPLHSVERGGT